MKHVSWNVPHDPLHPTDTEKEPVGCDCVEQEEPCRDFPACQEKPKWLKELERFKPEEEQS